MGPRTKESIRKMLATRKANKAAKMDRAVARRIELKLREQREAVLPVRMVKPENGLDAEEFAKFMTAAWRIYKGL